MFSSQGLLEMRKDFIKIRIQSRSAVVQGNVKTFVSPLEMEVLECEWIMGVWTEKIECVERECECGVWSADC